VGGVDTERRVPVEVTRVINSDEALRKSSQDGVDVLTDGSIGGDVGLDGLGGGPHVTISGGSEGAYSSVLESEAELIRTHNADQTKNN